MSSERQRPGVGASVIRVLMRVGPHLQLVKENVSKCNKAGTRGSAAGRKKLDLLLQEAAHTAGAGQPPPGPGQQAPGSTCVLRPAGPPDAQPAAHCPLLLEGVHPRTVHQSCG